MLVIQVGNIVTQGSVVPESILSGAVTDADIVFEAVTEDLGIKRGLFKDIASVCSKETILCTSTLSLALADVFADISSPEVGHKLAHIPFC